MAKASTPKTEQAVKVVAYSEKSVERNESRQIQLIREYGFNPRSKVQVEDGDVLPKKFEPFPNELLGRPLEEIDQFIYEETFCVVSKRFRKNYIHRFTGTKSLFIFPPWSATRRACVFLATNQFFDYLVMATILFNCVFLAMKEAIEEAEYIFLAIYSCEMIIKIIAKGFVLNKYTYLRNPWNWLDFVVITSGYATIGLDVGNLAGLRTFRVLRALKTVSIMPGLKTIINALLHSLHALAEVMTLTIFCLMVFALFALQVYMGELRNKCVMNIPEDYNSNTSYLWYKWINDSSHWYYLDDEPMICGNVTGARHCFEGYTCLCIGENPNHGYTSFDNFMWSMLTTFQLITLDYWENVYNMVLAACGPMSVSFFTVVVFFGSFYLINLMLAVVALSYEEEAEITLEERRKDLIDHRDDSTFSFDPTNLPVKQLNKNDKKQIDTRKGILLASYGRKKTRKRKRGPDKSKESANKPAADTENTNGNNDHRSPSLTPSHSPSPRHGNVRPQALALQRTRGLQTKTQSAVQKAPNTNTLHPLGAKSKDLLTLSSRQASSNASEGGVGRESSLDDSGVVDDHDEYEQSFILNKQRDLVPIALSPHEIRIIKCNGNIAKLKKNNIYSFHPEYLSELVVIDDLPTDRNCEKCMECCVDYAGWLQFQNCLYNIVKDPLFELGITLCIVLNTLFLALEHHGMSEGVRQALDIGNKVFTSIFTFECIMKVMSLSKEYFQCGWNIFDLIIVSASLLDLIFELVDGLSVLRGLRLLRVLKLAQSWTTMKVLLSIIISTIGALGNLTFVLVIVIYIFAVIGMQLFSKDYTEEKFYPDPVPRWNFNDFFHSFMMIFRILCGEWIEPLWDCMRAEEEQGASSCFAIFLPALVMGNFMVLNLFLALLLNSFNSEELKNKKEKYEKEVGEDSKLARSFERIKSLIHRRKMNKENNQNERNTRLEELVAELVNNQNKNKPILIDRKSEKHILQHVFYNESTEESQSKSNLIYEIPLKDRDTDSKTIDDNLKNENCYQETKKPYEQITKELVPNRSKLLHQMSSGFGTQQSKDDPTITESMELRTIGPTNSLDTDQSIQQTSEIQNYDESYLKHQKSLLNRSPSYRKSIDNISIKSDSTSQFCAQSLSCAKPLETLSPMHYLKSPESLHRFNRNLSRVASDASINTFSLEQDFTNGMNLRDELLNCEKRELFQFLSEDHDNSTNYFSDTVGIGSAMMDQDTDSLILSSNKDDERYRHVRKYSNTSIRSNLSNISNSVLQAIEKRRRSSNTDTDNSRTIFKRSNGITESKYEEKEPLVQKSEFDEIIKDFESELESIRSLSVDRCNKSFEKDLEQVENVENKVIFRRPSPHKSVNNRETALKRRSLEKQSKVSDEEFGINVELRKSLDYITSPSHDLTNMTSPILRNKSSFQNSFDRIKRVSLIERVEETNEDDKHIMCVESEKLPRKKLSQDIVDTESLMSTKSEENIFIARIPSRRESNLPNRADIKEFQRNLPADLRNTIMKKVTLKESVEHVEDQDLEKALSLKRTKEGTNISGKTWAKLVTYVDDLTVGGRRNSQGEYNDATAFPTFGNNKRPKIPQDCFPRKCYEKCPCWMTLALTKIGVKWTAIRTKVLSFVDTPAFEWFVLILIFASSVTLCFEDIHLEKNRDLKMILYWTNMVFCVIFTIEMLLKWLAFGFTRYFTSFWTILDFIIVLVSIFSLLIEENENLKVLRSLRTLRALRPLRAISRWQGMRIVVNALMYAIPSIFNVLLVCLVFWLIFSIMGVQFFGGKFFKCLDDDGELVPITIVNTKQDCYNKNFTWTNSKITFDHVGMGYLALFQVATFEGWMEVMADAVDARGVDLQPSREANLWAYIYFVIFIVCGSFFTLNLFIGVIIDNFNMLKKKYEGGVLEMFLTESQKHYYTAMKKLGRKKPQKVIKRPLNQILAMFYDLSNSRRFEIAIFVLIFLNMLSMGIEHYDQPHAVFFILEVSNAFFTTVFGLEAIVKIIGLRYHYFTVPWNVFDFILVLASILSIIMEDIMIDLPVSPTLLRVVRVFRIGRILRLIKAAKGIRKLLFALVVSLPALFNIGALLGLITFIYAIIGMSLFGHVRHQGALNDLINFETFGRSMQLLFRLMTSAGWNDVLESLMIQPPNCELDKDHNGNGDCGHPLLAITYFTSFIIINYMIVINMYIAIILENFNQAHQEEEIGIVEDDLEMFYIRWSKYDPHATQFIHFEQLADFIASLDPPLGIPKPNTVALVSFNLPIAKGEKIHCLDILHALVKHVLGHVDETETFVQLQEQMDQKFKKQFPTRKQLEITSSTRIWKREDKAARLIQRTWKEYLQMKKDRERSPVSDDHTQTSSPGGWQSRMANFLHLQVRRGTGTSSRASSRKSSRASDASDLSELAGPWLNLPLMMVSGATDLVKQNGGEGNDPGLPPTTPSQGGRRKSFYNFFLRHQDAMDDAMASPSVTKKPVKPNETQPQVTTEKSTPPAAPYHKSKRATSFVKRKPPLERGFSAQSALRLNRNPHLDDTLTSSPEVSITVTEPSPDQNLTTHEGQNTLVHVLVHRESEEYQTDIEDNDNNKDKKPIEKGIGINEHEIYHDYETHPIVTITVDGPKDTPAISLVSTPVDSELEKIESFVQDDTSAPIDVSLASEATNVYYDYPVKETDTEIEKDQNVMEESEKDS